ncbi:hypothetical protein, partial [Mesorhizobium sp. M2A.F.Ca.ET.039.01.1.1]|uniref:hypothetical protein n=1 Tax=Mesorhizobium sp. M2A.F.Ca.ET.039.01.1.1 TaxID=2496746 RepID=UPI000FF6AA8C
MERLNPIPVGAPIQSDGEMLYGAWRITKPPGKETVMDRVLVQLIAATSFLALSLLPAQSEPKHGIA